MYQLRNITNLQTHISHSDYPQSHLQKKIVHQLNNEGCKCILCQKIILNEMKIVKKVDFHDIQSEQTKGKKEQYLSQFLNEFFYIDKFNRKIKILLPQLCIFQKGNPVCLMTKKKDILPLKVIKNKQKMNAFQIQNFFIEGYIYHNNLKQNQEIMKNHKVTTLKKQYYKFDQYLKNQCIILVKFINGSCQMMTPVELNNLFKCKQKHIRQQIAYIQTMPCSQSYNQIRCHIDLSSRQYTGVINDLFQRAKNQVKMINQNIKPKDFMFIPQREERKFQEDLKKKDQKQYLKYLALKFLLVYSLRTDVLLQKCLFKFLKDEKQGNFYLIDIQVYKKCSGSKLWGQFQKKKAQSPTKNLKVKRRPASSPQKLQNKKIHTQDANLENLDIQLKKFVIDTSPNDNFTYHSKKHVQNKKQLKLIEQRIKSNSLFKLQPIRRNSQRTKRLVSSIIQKTDSSRMKLKRFI